MSAEALIKRGKRTVAQQLRAEFSRPEQQRQLNDLLNYWLDPHKALDSEETIEWLKVLIAGGVNFQDFANTGTCKLHKNMTF